MSNEHEAKSDTQRIIAEEVEKHSIQIIPGESIEEKLDKISLNLNGKTDAIARLRRAQGKMISEVAKMPTSEQFESVRVLAEGHAERFRRFDKFLTDSLQLVRDIWRDIRKGVRNAIVLFISAVVLYLLLRIFHHFFPSVHLQIFGVD